MNRILKHVRGNLVAYLALFVALGGTSYAALRLPAGSVGTRQLRNHSVTPIKFDRKVGAYVRAWAVIQGGTKVIESRPRARVVSWDPAAAAGLVTWGSAVANTCFPLATAGRDFVQVALLPVAARSVAAHYQVYDNAGHFDAAPPVINIAVLCP